MKTPRLETERLILRPVRADDAAETFDCWMRDEEVSRYMLWNASNDIRDAESFVEYELAELENSLWNRWMIVLKSSGKLIGTCLLFYNEDERHWDISYNLGTAFWGKGYTTEAMQTVMEFAAEELNVTQIETSYAKENAASGRVLKKLGFETVGEIPYSCGGEACTEGVICLYRKS